MLVHAIKNDDGKLYDKLRNRQQKKAAFIVIALHNIAPGDAPYLWEALRELKQPQSVDKALEISKEYAKGNNHL